MRCAYAATTRWPRCTGCWCARRGSRSRRRGAGLRTCAASSWRTSPCRAPTTRSWPYCAKLDDFRGDSRFTTWAYKFALLEAAVRLRRLAWQGREVPVESRGVGAPVADGRVTPQRDVELRELLEALRAAIDEQLSARQREVLVATTIAGVPIDVLAERLDTTRGALYKTLHDARQKLRRCLAEQGLDLGA